MERRVKTDGVDRAVAYYSIGLLSNRPMAIFSAIIWYLISWKLTFVLKLGENHELLPAKQVTMLGKSISTPSIVVQVWSFLQRIWADWWVESGRLEPTNFYLKPFLVKFHHTFGNLNKRPISVFGQVFPRHPSTFFLWARFRLFAYKFFIYWKHMISDFKSG